LKPACLWHLITWQEVAELLSSMGTSCDGVDLSRKGLVGSLNFAVAGFILTFLLVDILKYGQTYNGIQVLTWMLWGALASFQIGFGIWVILEYRNSKPNATN